MNKTISQSNIKGLKLSNRGKVRDIYDLGKELLIVATDRISTFDVVLPTPIPRKGEILTQMSLFWFRFTKSIIGNHLSDTHVSDVVADTIYHSRSMIVKKARPLALEAIVRGYLSGSGLKEYQSTGSVCGIKLQSGLLDSSKLAEPIFTPSTKAAIGSHDENISFEKLCSIIGKDTARKVRDVSLTIYKEASQYALNRGIIIADTKFEFGLVDNEIILIDEVLTPDSSRFWPANDYKEGQTQDSFDKQYVRDWLIKSGWDKKPPAPELPIDIVTKTTLKYEDALQKITS